MTLIAVRRLLIVVCAVAAHIVSSQVTASDLSERSVIDAIVRAKDFLAKMQRVDGSWGAGGGTRYQVGVTSLALLALSNAKTNNEPPHVKGAVKKGYQFLRSAKDPQLTYEVSLMIMALAAAKDNRDNARLATLVNDLEQGQIKRGLSAGSWSYNVRESVLDLHGDRSNGQFAILGLRDASQAGISVDRTTWQRAQRHWIASQSSDGGWGYSRQNNFAVNHKSTGSMTVAGIATLAITSLMLTDDRDVNSDGTPNCCTKEENEQVQKALKRSYQWIARRFTVGHNPGSGSWLLYYLYGLERAGRLSGRRFFGQHDWYREGARFLIDRQDQFGGGWLGVGGLESKPEIGTSFALLFLSKGLAPVLFNNLKYGRRDPNNRTVLLNGDDWNLHPYDVRNLTEHISGLKGWPKLLTTQVVDIDKVVRDGSVSDLLQSRILYISGQNRLDFSEQEIELLKEYVNKGGFIFAVNCCQGAGFHDGIRDLAKTMYPQSEATLKPLLDEHPIFRSEYLLSPETVNLWGVDVGCRTAIVYSPDDLSCLWNKWMRHDPPKRMVQLKVNILRATKIGVNVVAYAIGREPPNKLQQHELTTQEGRQDKIKRGFLQIAKLRHTGGWDAAPRALRNLLLALNRSVGMTAATKHLNLPATDPNLFKYPILYMHGRNRFQMSRREREPLQQYLYRGGVLFADACCSSAQFDRSFQQLMEQMFPDKKLNRIPKGHEMFTTSIGYDITTVRRRGSEANNRKVALNTVVKQTEPFLQGIEIDGRYAVIYSRYDISCALEGQASVACTGYVPEDAVKIGVNVVLYAMLQNVGWEQRLSVD